MFMTLLEEFKKFIARGNVLDLAVGVMIGAAFGRIVTSLTENVIMPLIGWMFGSIDFSKYFIRLGPIPPTYDGSPTDFNALKAAGVAMIGYGEFITQIVNFLIIAMVLFLLLRSVNKIVEEAQFKKKQADTASQQVVPTDPQLDVLREILEEMRKAPKA
jgi:large conductance mechanosensitive channel